MCRGVDGRDVSGRLRSGERSGESVLGRSGSSDEGLRVGGRGGSGADEGGVVDGCDAGSERRTR